MCQPSPGADPWFETTRCDPDGKQPGDTLVLDHEPDDQTLALDALGMALRTRRPEPGLPHHSDRSVQYASGDYQTQLRECGTVCSMSRKGDSWDNAVAESFFSTLKAELVHRTDYASRTLSRASVFEYIEAFYNDRRRHSAFG